MFGKVAEGYAIVEKIEKWGSRDGVMRRKFTIADCGEIVPEEKGGKGGKGEEEKA